MGIEPQYGRLFLRDATNPGASRRILAICDGRAR
jgi:hypothetical protein